MICSCSAGRIRCVDTWADRLSRAIVSSMAPSIGVCLFFSCDLTRFRGTLPIAHQSNEFCTSFQCQTDFTHGHQLICERASMSHPNIPRISKYRRPPVKHSLGSNRKCGGKCSLYPAKWKFAVRHERRLRYERATENFRKGDTICIRRSTDWLNSVAVPFPSSTILLTFER